MGSFSIGSVFGVEIRIDYSWFIIFFLILWSFTAGVFPASFPGLSPTTYLVMGVVGTLLFFASLLAHELSHALTARARGIEVEGITLFIFGGMARTKSESRTPGEEFLIAGVGPLSSLVIALLLAAVWRWGDDVGLPLPVTGVAAYLAFLNFILAVFNLLPGFPLDGGRLFRAAAWKATGDLTRATRWASTAGKILGYLLIAWGIYSFFSGEALGGLWMVFIGWFLRSAAVMAMRQHLLQEAMTGVRAGEAMTPHPETVPPHLSLRHLVDERFMHRHFRAYPVEEGGRTLGIISLRQLEAVPREAWDSTAVSEAMVPIQDVPQVGPEDTVDVVLKALRGFPDQRALVMEDGRLVGIISPGDLATWMEQVRKIRELEAS
ncbi:MAG TPA: site-2 protease family protein [Longimicrobiales bacterium]|nr:site-2 protease family protein [Longimicrobiales bacterium]